MSAADAREELEAAVRQQATYLEAHTGRYRCAVSEDGMALILAGAGRYAEAVAHEAMDLAEGRERLEQATAEASGGAS